MITVDTIPVLPRGVRCQHDSVRGVEVLLGPERVLMLDAIGVAILSRVSGTAAVAQITQELCTVYDAPRDVIEPDVIAYLQDLADKRLVDVTYG